MHSWSCPICRCSKIGIISTATILSVSNYSINLRSASTVIIFLKITARIIKPILIPNIMHDIIHVKQVSYCCIAIIHRSLIHIKRKIEIERSSSGWRISGTIVTIGIFHCIYVIASCSSVFSTCSTIGIMPTIWGGRCIVRANYQTARTMTWTFDRNGKNSVLIGTWRRRR